MKRILTPALVAVAAAAVLAFAGGAGASGPTFSGTLTSTPDVSIVKIPYSTVGGPTTYVQYVTTFARTSTDTSSLTHATISQPVTNDPLSHNAVAADFPGPIVSLSSSPVACIPTYRDSNTGVACDFGSLKQGAVITLTVVVQMPTGTVASSFDALAGLTVKEGGNDSQPNSSYSDTFFTNSLTTNLTTDTANAFNTFTLPDGSGSFQTSGNGLQQSGVSWSATTGFPGGALKLQQCGGLGSACPTGTPNPCGAAKCSTQTSIVIVPGSGTFFSSTSPLTITLTFFAFELPAKFVLSQFTIYHDGSVVSSCKKQPPTDPTGDCISSLTQDKTTGNVTAVITGPANGGWGGAG